MDMIDEIISASKKPPVIKTGTSLSEKKPKKVQFKKGVPSGEKVSRRLKGIEASRISSLHGRTKAQEVVLHLIENTVLAKELEDMCRYIIPGQYEDVCLERCISGVCGYPLCRAPHKDNFGKKEVIFRHNKVYDIGRRRNFCSDVCFEASALVSEQISFTPHYLREHESWEELVVTVPDSSKLKGRRGDLRDVGGDTEFAASMRKMRQERLRPKTGSSSKTVEEAALAGLLANEDETPPTIDEETVQQLSQQQPASNSTAPINNTVPDVHDSRQDKENGNCESLINNNKKSKKKRKSKVKSETATNEKDSLLNINNHRAANEDDNLDVSSISTPIRDSRHNNNKILNKLKECSDDRTAMKELQQSQNDSEESMATMREELVKQVEEHFVEWLTWDSYIIVLGETFLQGLLESKGLMGGECIKQQPVFESALDSDVCRLRYWRLCSQLARQERLEELEAASLASDVKPRPRKDAPDMETLRQDVQKMALKVKCFLSGNEEQVEEEDDLMNEETAIPLVDRYGQRTWRRKVFFENIHKAERAVVAGLALSEDNLRPLLSQLVTSFNLTAHNLYLKTHQWTLVVLILLKLLGVRYPAISAVLSDATFLEREVWPRLATLALPTHYLDTVIHRLLDTNIIINKFMDGPGPSATSSNTVTQNTMENNSTTTQEDYSHLEVLD